jgi:eukaryotic-like serine/threonine-protein kinase
VNIPGTPSSRAPIPARPAPVQPGEVVAGKYRVGRVLGAGAMGVVVRAWHVELEQDVALKFLHPELALKADGAERFRREARAAVRIRSDHVARVLDVGTLEGAHVPFIVMEYLQGRDLARELAARGSLPVDEVARHVLEACDAVGEAHARGIVHRDLKPANLFLAERSGGTQMIKVLDFGISKMIGSGPKGLSITEPATLMGSPGYMSPEQLESSRNVDARTDIWSLGVILQEMATGALPFDGESVPQLIRAVISGNRPSLSDYGPALATLEPVVARCLQQDRAQRFQSIAELRAALLPLASLATAATVTGLPRPLVPVGVASSPAASSPAAASPAPASPAASTPAASAPGKGAASGPPASSGAVRGGAVSSGAARVARTVGAETTGAHDRPGGTPDSAWGRTHGFGRAPLWRTLALAAALGATAAFAFWRGRAALQSMAGSPSIDAAASIEVVSGSAPPPVPLAAQEVASIASPALDRPEPKVAPIAAMPPGSEAAATAAPVAAAGSNVGGAAGDVRPTRVAAPVAPPQLRKVRDVPSFDIGGALGTATSEAAPGTAAPAPPPEAPSATRSGEAPPSGNEASSPTALEGPVTSGAAPPADGPPADGPPADGLPADAPPSDAPPGAAPADDAPGKTPTARNPYEIPEFGGRK